MPRRLDLRAIAFDRGGLLGLAVLVLYIALAPAVIVDGDSAELATLGVTGGAAHPPGYPLYVLYLRATSWLPGSTPAHTAAIATGILGAAAIVVLHAACRAWGARPAAASVTCAVFAAGPIVLRMHTQAEVFALAGLIAAAILWLAAPAGPVRGGRRTILLALVAGLGLANHAACVALAPIGLYGAVLGLREAAAGRARIAALAIGALGLGLLPYLYLLGSTATAWGGLDGPGAVVRHFLRLAYGGPLQLGAGTADVPSVVSLAALAATMGRVWLWLPLVVGVVALVVGCRRGPHRRAWLVLAMTILIAGPLLATRLGISPDPGIGLVLCQRFHLLATLLLAVPVAVGLDWVIASAARQLPPVRAARWVAGAAALAVLGGATALSRDAVARAHSPAVERGLAFALATAPAHAILVTIGDHLDSGGAYLQVVRGMRPDVTMVNPGMMGMAWYRARVARRFGTGVIDRSDHPAVVLVRIALATGRPVLVDHVSARDLTAWPQYAHGMMLRLLPLGALTPSIDQVIADNEALYARLVIDYPLPRPTDDWAALIHLHYVYSWLAISDELERAREPDRARIVRRHALALRPVER